MATTSFPPDKQLPNTDNIIRQTDCTYAFQNEYVSFTMRFMGDTKEAVSLASSYRSGKRVKLSDLTSKFTELNGVLPTSQLEASGKVMASTISTKTGCGSTSITVQVPYKKKLSIRGGGGSGEQTDAPEKRIITTWSEKSTTHEFPLKVYAGKGESASECNAGKFEAWEQMRTADIELWKEFKYKFKPDDANEEPKELEGNTLKLAQKVYDGVEVVDRGYPEVIRTTQYLNYDSKTADEVDDDLIKQITRKPPKLYYRDQTPAAVWKSLFDKHDWLKTGYDVNVEPTEYSELWNITVTECWQGISIAEKGTWDDDLYGADGVRWKFATAGNIAQPSGQYNDGTPIQPTDVDGNGRIKPTTFDSQNDIKDLDTGGDFYAVDDNAFKATPTRSLTAGVPDLETIKMPEINYIGNDAFNGAANLKSVRVENQVTFLGTNAFKGCTSMTEAHFAPSIYTMPASTFEGCTSLDIPPDEETMKIGGLVNAIGASAFKDCTSLTAVECMNAISSIEDNAFDGDTELKFFGVPTDSTGTITLGDEAFKGCAKLADIELPVPTITLGTDTFDGAFDDEVTVKAPKSFLSNLPNTSSYNYIYPAFVDTIASGEWQNDTKLLSAVVCDAITSIPANVFRGCTNCTSVILPDTTTSIGAHVFRASGITSFTVPPLVTTLNTCAFLDCASLTSVDLNNVTTLGQEVFNRCTALTEIDLPETLTSIGNSSFQGCTALKSAIMPENATGTLTLGDSVFNGCSALERLDLPVGTLTVGSTVFNNALASECWIKAPFNSNLVGSIPSGKLVNYIYPSFTTSIASGEFRGNTNLKSVAIPGGVTSIGTNSFRYCGNLSSVTLTEGLTSISEGMFQECNSLTSIDLPSTITSIGTNAFRSSTGLTSITLPDGLTSIGIAAFRYCSALTGVALPEDLTTINERAFSDCTALASVNLPDSLTTIGDKAFSSCYALTSLTLPNNSTSIGSGAFEYCTGLATITVPLAITSIGSNAFQSAGSSTALPEVTMTGRTVSDVQGMTNYPWGLRTGTTVHCTDGDITI